MYNFILFIVRFLLISILLYHVRFMFFSIEFTSLQSTVINSTRTICISNREGDISLVQADVITNTTDETLSERNIISDRILQRAGAGLRRELLTEIRGEYRVTIAQNCAPYHIQLINQTI